MLTELVTLTTADGKALDGALYRPTARANLRRGILLVHGLTWNFYQGPSRWLPPRLTERGYTCLSINMRDHDRAEPLEFDLSYHDIQAGIDRLIADGLDEVIVLAHGYGCNKAVVFAAQSGNSGVERYVLATLGSVKGYRPDIWVNVLAKADHMRGRALVVQGTIDTSLEPQPRADEFVAATNHCAVDVVLLAGADHYFATSQQELADCILDWCSNSKPTGNKQP
jgi:pimeloyl-ACP methyl ester carboxylesterase